MRKYILSILLLVAVFLAGCTKSELQIPVYNDFRNINSEIQTEAETNNEVLKNYEIGISKNCNVGNEIISIKSYKKLVTKKFDRIKKFKALMSSQYTQIGKIYKISGTSLSNSSHYFIFLFEDTSGMYKYLKINSTGHIISNDLFDSFGQTTVQNYFSLVGQKIFEPDTDILEINEQILKGSFSKELIYGGKDGNNIKISYREYKNDMARPAFFQDLTYNLKESDIIRYKNYKIKVHKATNEEISYTVLEG